MSRCQHLFGLSPGALLAPSKRKHVALPLAASIHPCSFS